MSVRYLMSIQELKESAAADLGSMDEKSYDEFMAEAARLAPEHGINRPKIIIDIKFKTRNPMGVTEQPYPVSRDEWEMVLRDARRMCEYIPHVYLVDGERFTAPI